MTTEFVEQNVNLTEGLAVETLPDLSDLADEPGGPLAKGWYKGEIIEGYATRSGKQQLTEDVVSGEGDSRNLRVCFKVSTQKEPRNIKHQFNYRQTDFTADRIAFIKQLREDMKHVQGQWPNKDAQRTSLSLAKLGQFQKAVGKIGFSSNGFVTGPLVSTHVDVYVSTDQNGYNVITQFAPIGKFTGPAKPVSKSA